MANAKIFCNTPWYEAHIYWDGSLGICCQESRKLSTDPKYNIRSMSLTEWFNSEPVRELRQAVLSNTPTDLCRVCYNEEESGSTSRRHRSNQKSVIFTRNAFDDSYQQSPGYPHFILSQDQDGFTDTFPIDLHIDLGNYCNLACKMCSPRASTTIAVQHVKWGIESDRQYLGVDWTKDPEVWHKFLNELLTIPKLKNIHFMGGETLLTPRLEELVDFMTAHNRFDLCFSFVTNGTVYNPKLIDKLKKFSRVGIEISIETTTLHNDYIRQGTNTQEVLANVARFKTHSNNSTVSITIRPAINLLSIGYYYTLLEYCLENQLLVKSLLVSRPAYLDSKILPKSVKDDYIKKYQQLLTRLLDINVDQEFNESDPNNYKKSILLQIQQVITLLERPGPDGQEILLKAMVEHCQKWDKIYNFNARNLYPELADIFKKYDY